jgi:hypothetical protein
MSPWRCRGSDFLEDFGLEHGELEDCDDLLDEKLSSWVYDMYKYVNLRLAKKELESRISGTWMCTIL